MTETKYLLFPQWSFTNGDQLDFDVPPYFMKLFSSKKEIADYLTNNDVKKELRQVKNDAFVKMYKNLPQEEQHKALINAFKDYNITFWVITINPLGKENRIGMMYQHLDRKDKKWVWKYASYFGGKVWKDQLMFGIYR